MLLSCSMLLSSHLDLLRSEDNVWKGIITRGLSSGNNAFFFPKHDLLNPHLDWLLKERFEHIVAHSTQSDSSITLDRFSVNL